MAGNYVAQQAGNFALQSAAGRNGGDAADYVQAQLDGLSQRSLRDQLGAALTAAQNEARFAAIQAASEKPRLIATELLDQNTCEACIAEDGKEFDTPEEARAAYPNGGYINCAGFEHCRGTVMGLWGEA